MGTRTVNGVRIDTAYVRPPMPISMPLPIPGHQRDWVAAEVNYDLGRPIGTGETEQDAIDDLLEQLEQ